MDNAGFNLDIRGDGVAVITIDTHGESQNTLKAELIEQANAMFDQLEQDSTVKGLIFISAKPGSFIAGADISMIKNCESAEQATEWYRW